MEILPPEIWDTILFEYVRDKGDLFLCCQTCKVWEDVLCKNGKTQFLLPYVIPILENYLGRHDLLTCRLVSQDWKDGIDSSELDYWSSDTFQNLPEPNQDFSQVATLLTGTAGIERFIIEMESCTTNPFPNHALILTLPVEGNKYLQDPNLSESYPMFTTLTEKFGKYVKKCRYVVQAVGISQFPNRFHTFLLQLPNLESLKLEFAMVNMNECFQIEDNLGEDNPFPAMNNLKHLSLCDIKTEALANALCSAYKSQLVSFSSCWDDEDPWMWKDNACHPYQNLFLNLPEGLSQISVTPVTLNLLRQTISGEVWPLRKLSLGIYDYHQGFQKGGEAAEVTLTLIFQLMDKFGNSLEEALFRIQCFGCRPQAECEKQLRRICPCNKKMTLANVVQVVKYKRLKTLEIPHSILRPRVFQKVMEKCVVLETLILNAYQGEDSSWRSKRLNLKVLPGGVLKCQRKLLLELGPDLPETLTKFSLMTQGGKYNEGEYRFDSDLLQLAKQTKGKKDAGLSTKFVSALKFFH